MRIPLEPVIGRLTHCQICNATSFDHILSLGHHPLTQAYLTEDGLHEPETFYPLTIVRCVGCGLVQLDYLADPKIVFPPSYPYQTGMTSMLVRNFRALADLLATTYSLTAADLVMDIGSNDGTLLGCLKEKGMRVIGVEPTDVAKIANSRGIPTIQTYFTESAARDIRAVNGPARVVAATNSFAHTNNLYEMLRGIKTLLSPDGVFVAESQYLMDIVETNEVDTIYHEHLRFYALTPMLALFRNVGMSLVDAERIPAAGGSIRTFAMQGEHPPSARLRELLAAEDRAGITTAKTLATFAARARHAKQALLALLGQLRRDSARIVGIGSPGRGNSLINFMGIDTDLVDYLVERTGSPKIGLYTPGTHLKVEDEARLFAEQPEYALILSWHIADELVGKLKQLGFRGRCIIPLPEPRIIE